jgi:putative DNA primase/helicase
MMGEQIGDECRYLRINELKKGNIQFTDATNALRLYREHGANIRYNPAWKKWLVWNGTHWEMDEEDALIHEKGLETVHNIYDEVLKTDDYRERIEIEKHAMLSESMRRREAFIKAASVMKVLQVTAENLDPNP